jgi:hypothetical protein
MAQMLLDVRRETKVLHALASPNNRVIAGSNLHK